MILSSARLMKEADEMYRRELGEPDTVISSAALGCLLYTNPRRTDGSGDVARSAV